MRRTVAFASCVAALAGAPIARADGPGLPNQAYPASDVFKVIGRIDGALGAPRGHGTMHMHRGYLAIVFAPDSGKGLGGFAFFDVSNPRAPKLFARKDDAETQPLREAHGYGFHGDLVFLQSIKGMQVWDWADPANPKRLADAAFPRIAESDYGTGAWWISLQYPWAYLGGSGNGLYIIDVSDPKNPKLADRGGKPNPIPASQLGGFRIGPVFAVGNLLVATSMDEAGYATLDIGDPVQPKLLKTAKVGLPVSYSTLVNGNRIYGAGNDNKIHVHEITNPAILNYLGATPVAGDDKGGYVTIQDGFAHAGMGVQYAKFDVRIKGDFKLIGTATSGLKGRDEDFATVLGNLVFVGDDHGKGTSIVPHQAAPDTTPPEVNMVVPKSGATKQPITTRVGLTFSDQIDPSTVVVGKTFLVRKVGGAPIAGKISYQTNILNFAPDAPLEADATYEVVVPEGGIKDVAGNATGKSFTSSFSTGVGSGAGCTIAGAPNAVVSSAASYKVTTPVGAGYTYTWDFGDGSNPTAGSSSPEVTYTFKTPGHWTVTASVSGKDLDTSCTLPVTVTYPATAKPPTRSTSIVLDEPRKRVWVVNPDADSIAGLSTDPIKKVFEVKVGKHPRTLAVAPDGTVWVANEDSGTVSIVDGNAGTLVGAIPMPYASRPYGITFSPDGAMAYVTLGAIGKLARIETSSRKVLALLDVGPSPRGVAVSGDGTKVLVTRFLSPLDTAEVTEVDGATFTVARKIELPYDKGPDSESTGRGVLNYLSSIAISPDGRRAFVPAKKDNITRGLRRDDKPLGFDSTVRTGLAHLDLLKGEEDVFARLDFNDRSLAFDVATSKLGDILFVSTTGTNTVEVVDAFSGQIVTSIEKIGAAPQGLLLEGNRLWVQGFLSRDVTVFDVKGILDFSDGKFTRVDSIRTVDVEPLPAPVLLGKKVFYDASDERMSKDKYISCATCHLDGGEDGRVWDFTDRGEGLRNTISLLGRRGTGHGRMHWSANFDEVQDFENDIRNAFGGTGFLPADKWEAHQDTLGAKKAGLSPELDALAAYVVSLPAVHPSPFRNEDGSLTDDGLRGLAIFRRVGCGNCHSGPDLTDSATGKLHDVGTRKRDSGQRLGKPLEGLDTPTLRGIWETAPYLHDGSARTLMEVFTLQDASGKHRGPEGVKLSQEELEHLVAYLRQIDDHDDSGVDPDERLRSKGCGCTIVGARGGPLPLAACALAAMFLRRARRKRRR